MEKTKSKTTIILGIIIALLAVCVIVLWAQLKKERGENFFSFFKASQSEAIVITSSVNVRQEPDMTSQRIGALVHGQKIKVLGHSEGWTYIEIDGQKGYVKSEYLSESKSKSTSKEDASSAKNKAERSAKNQSEIGIFTQDKKITTDFYAYTANGFVCIHVPEEAVDLEFDGSVLSYHIRSKWADVLYTYDIDMSLTDKYDTERKIDSITSSFIESNTQLRGYTTNEIVNALERIQEGGGAIPTVWWKNVGQNGASYVFTGPVDVNNHVRTATLSEEAFNYIDGITIQEKVEVICVDFITYKNSLDTTMAQKQAEEECAEYINSLKNNISVHVEGDTPSYTNSIYDFIDLFKARRPIDIR